MVCLGWFHRGGIQVWRGQKVEAGLKGMENRRGLGDANQKSRGGTDLPCNADLMIARMDHIMSEYINTMDQLMRGTSANMGSRQTDEEEEEGADGEVNCEVQYT
jgi:hypothetical protein